MKQRYLSLEVQWTTRLHDCYQYIKFSKQSINEIRQGSNVARICDIELMKNNIRLVNRSVILLRRRCTTHLPRFPLSLLPILKNDIIQIFNVLSDSKLTTMPLPLPILYCQLCFFVSSIQPRKEKVMMSLKLLNTKVRLESSPILSRFL